jgi:hypothetical protein
VALAGIPVRLYDHGVEGKTIIFEPTDFLIHRDPFGEVVVSEVDLTNPMDEATIEKYLEPEGVILIIDAENHSRTYQRCLDSTTEEATTHTDMVLAANIAWATCARENGWPDIADPGPTTAGAVPSVELPSEMTLEELNLLLESCVPLDTSTDPPTLPYITVGPSDGTVEGASHRESLLDRLNEAQSEAWEEWHS